MTTDEQTPIGNSGQVQDLAQLFRTTATEILDVYGDATSRLDETTWSGRRADQAREGLTAKLARVNWLDEELRDLAVVLDNHADWIERTKAELLAIEQAYEQYLSTSGWMSPTGTPLPSPAPRPPRYSPQWWTIKKTYNL